MPKKIIRLGDPIAPIGQGGNVIASGAPQFTVSGVPVALLGDACSCHPGCTIAQGDPEHTVHGIPVAYEGHQTTCGRALISTIDHYTKS